MLGITDIAKLTEFDCYCCTPAIPCNVIGCATDYECNDCPEQMKNVCRHIGTYCRPVYFSNLAWLMIMDGWNYEVSQDYCKPIERNYTDVRIPF